MRIKVDIIDNQENTPIRFVIRRRKYIVELDEFNKKYNKFSSQNLPESTGELIINGVNGIQEVNEISEFLQPVGPKIPFNGIIQDLFNNPIGGFDKEKEIIVESQKDKFLHLPWEELSNRVLSIIKKIEIKKRKNRKINTNSSKKILILSSAARDIIGQNKTVNLTEDTKSELSEIINLKNQIYDANFNRRIEYFFIIRNFNIHSKIRNIPNCDVLHLICHGEPDGTTHISVVDKPNEIHKVYSAKLTRLLLGKKFYIGYLSFCHSGSGSINQNSLAYELVYNGICKYCVAFQRSIDSQKSIKFTEIFYVNLLKNNFDILTTYKNLFEDNANSAILKELRPVLYF